MLFLQLVSENIEIVEQLSPLHGAAEATVVGLSIRRRGVAVWEQPPQTLVNLIGSGVRLLPEHDPIVNIIQLIYVDLDAVPGGSRDVVDVWDLRAVAQMLENAGVDHLGQTHSHHALADSFRANQG